MRFPVARLATLLVAGALFFSGCAKRGLPPGGPEDKTAPVVQEMSPASGAVGVDLKSKISLTFSEPMKHRTVETAVIVSPPCRWVKRYWQHETYVLIADKPLLAQTTYLVSVGASATDRHANKLGKTYVAGFSTGETIEAGVISGKVIWKGLTVEQAIVGVFDATEIGEITGFPTATPAYVTLTGTGGHYDVPFVDPDRTYCVFAFNDQNTNSEYDKGEPLGCAGGQVTLADSMKATGVDIVLCGDELRGSLKGIVIAPAGFDTLQAPQAPQAPKGKGTPKLAVWARVPGDSSASYTVGTDPKGAFEISCMRPGRYLVTAFIDYNGNQKKDPADTVSVDFGETMNIEVCAKPRSIELRF